MNKKFQTAVVIIMLISLLGSSVAAIVMYLIG